MTEIIQLETDVNRVFDDSLPTWPGLSPQSARLAVMMHKAGRDAAAIADRVDMPLGSVLAFLDRVKGEESKREQAQLDRASVAAPDEDFEEEAAAVEAAAPSPPRPTQSRPPRDTRPDIKLSALQQSVIRRLRQTRVSVSTIAKMMRLSPDQVMRIAGEIP